MRLARVVLVLAVLLAMAMPAVAELKVTFGGYADYGFSVGLSPFAAQDRAYERLYVTAAIDDFVKAYIRLDFNQRALLTGTVAAPAVTNVGNAEYWNGWASVNVAKFFKLDAQKIALDAKFGRVDSYDNSYGSTTSWGAEDIGNAGAAETAGNELGYEVIAGYSDLVTLKFAQAPAIADDFFVGIYHNKKYGTTQVSAEVFYYGAEAVVGTPGRLIIDGQIQPVMGDLALDFGAGFRYQLSDSAWAWGFGAGAKYKTLVGGRVGVYGNNTAVLSNIVADVMFTPVALVDFLAAAKFNVMPTFGFVSADIAARLNIGVADLYFGYLVDGTAVGTAPAALWAPKAIDGGSPYVKVVVSY